MPFPLGTVAARKLKEAIQTHLESAVVASALRSRGHVEVNIDGDDKTSGVRVVILSGADEQLPHEYDGDGGKRVLEESHRVTVGLMSSEMSGATRRRRTSTPTEQVAPLDEAVFSLARRALKDHDGMNALGVFNIREIADELDTQGVEFKRQINITCSTDTFIT